MLSVQSVASLAQSWQFVCFVAVFFLWRTVRTVRQYRRLRHFRGPWWAAWTEVWLFKAAIRGDFHLVAEELFQKYGIRDLDGCTIDLTADVR
jgi:hypothetical protein